MSVALDVGSFRIKSLRLDGDRLASRSCRAVYAVLPDTSAYRDMLRQLDASFAVCDGSLAVFGDQADELSWLAGIPCAQILPAGSVPHDDPPARQMLSTIVDALLPEPTTPNEICCFVPPAAALQRGAAQQMNLLTQIITLRGYQPQPVAPGMAILLAEATSSRFTGIGLSLGESSCSYSIAWHGVELTRGTVLAGGGQIDSRLAERNKRYVWDRDGSCYLDTPKAHKWKHTFGGRIDDPGTMLEHVLCSLYEELLEAVFADMERSLKRCVQIDHLAGQSLPLICCGGPTAVNGFRDVATSVLESAELPITVGPVQVALNSQYTVARGCLIHANLEAEVAAPERSAA